MDKKRKYSLLKLCDKLHITMNDLSLLDMALTHTSYAYESKKRPRPENNERLEFLGDSVLSLVVSTYIYGKYAKKAEGFLSKLRAFLVCEATLAKLAKKVELGEHLLLGHGETSIAGEERPSILADAFESVIGAYYLDQGFSAVQKFLDGILLQQIPFLVEEGFDLDYKTRLQEEAQKNGAVDIVYEQIEATGPAHNRTFSMRVLIDGVEYGKGVGHSKKEAEQCAAHIALDKKTAE